MRAQHSMSLGREHAHIAWRRSDIRVHLMRGMADVYAGPWEGSATGLGRAELPSGRLPLQLSTPRALERDKARPL
eukprot:scaffold2234_cov66-Phaeocystis_antarctica.AAC.2